MGGTCAVAAPAPLIVYCALVTAELPIDCFTPTAWMVWEVVTEIGPEYRMPLLALGWLPSVV